MGRATASLKAMVLPCLGPFGRALSLASLKRITPNQLNAQMPTDSDRDEERITFSFTLRVGS